MCASIASRSLPARLSDATAWADTARGSGTCMGRPGSDSHETLDAQTFASWGVDYLKVQKTAAVHYTTILFNVMLLCFEPLLQLNLCAGGQLRRDDARQHLGPVRAHARRAQSNRSTDLLLDNWDRAVQRCLALNACKCSSCSLDPCIILSRSLNESALHSASATAVPALPARSPCAHGSRRVEIQGNWPTPTSSSTATTKTRSGPRRFGRVASSRSSTRSRFSPTM
jgi:hypothetical protein